MNHLEHTLMLMFYHFGLRLQRQNCWPINSWGPKSWPAWKLEKSASSAYLVCRCDQQQVSPSQQQVQCWVFTRLVTIQCCGSLGSTLQGAAQVLQQWGRGKGGSLDFPEFLPFELAFCSCFNGGFFWGGVLTPDQYFSLSLALSSSRIFFSVLSVFSLQWSWGLISICTDILLSKCSAASITTFVDCKVPEQQSAGCWPLFSLQ